MMKHYIYILYLHCYFDKAF